MPRVLFGSLLAVIACVVALPAKAQIPINVESTPPGATVFVDAPTTPIGTTPLRNVRVARGSHTLIFRLENHEEGRLPVNVSRRRETFRIVLNSLSTISVFPQNDSAQGASLRIDGQPVGNLPYRGTIQPGRHMVQVGREDYVTFSQWVELAGGQVLTLPVQLERERPSTGSVLVAGDVSGAPIFIDGDDKGATPAVIEGLTAGQHTVEIRPAGMPVFRDTITVVAGQRIAMNPTLRPAPPPGGTLRVISNVPHARISLDGEAIGEAPVTKDAVTPGEHILEAVADGFLPAQQPVTIETGHTRVVSLQLNRREGAPGRVVVNSNVGSATVIIDGQERGNPPVIIENATAGTHAVIVRSRGYEDFRSTCDVGPGQNCEIAANLVPGGTPVRIEANISNAELYVDGQMQGPVPYEGTLPVGQHRMEVRALGYRPHSEQINLAAADTPRVFNITLVRIGEDLTPEEREEIEMRERRRRAGAVTHAAGPLPADLAALDVSVGWPYIVEIRLSVGILDVLEAGFAMRTFGRLTEFEGRGELGVRPLEQVAAALQARAGGGLGPDVDMWFFTLEGLLSLYFADHGAFTLWLGFDAYTDGYQFGYKHPDNAMDTPDPDLRGQVDNDLCADGTRPLDEDDPCPVRAAMGTTPARPGVDDRQNQTRGRLGGALEIVLSPHTNLWGSLEGIVADPGEAKDRRLLGDIFGLGIEDTELYLRVGFTHKF